MNRKGSGRNKLQPNQDTILILPWVRKGKSAPCIRDYAMKTWGGVDVWNCIFLTPALVGGGCLLHRWYPFYWWPGEPQSWVGQCGVEKILDLTGTRTLDSCRPAHSLSLYQLCYCLEKLNKTAENLNKDSQWIWLRFEISTSWIQGSGSITKHTGISRRSYTPTKWSFHS
jgi:hypothetical protein